MPANYGAVWGHDGTPCDFAQFGARPNRGVTENAGEDAEGRRKGCHGSEMADAVKVRFEVRTRRRVARRPRGCGDSGDRRVVASAMSQDRAAVGRRVELLVTLRSLERALIARNG
jgi:hypothetical protein